MPSKAQIAVIHVAKGKIGMDEDEYRALLSSFGVSSSVHLNETAFHDIMKHFEKLGFKSKYAEKSKPPESKKRLLAKIYAIQHAMSLKDTYIDAIVRKMFHVDSYKWLDASQLHKLVIALTYYQRKKERQ